MDSFDVLLHICGHSGILCASEPRRANLGRDRWYSNDPGVVSGKRHIDACSKRYGFPVPGLEGKSKSPGKHHRRHCLPRCVRKHIFHRKKSWLLPAFCNRKSPAPYIGYLVRMEVAKKGRLKDFEHAELKWIEKVPNSRST